MHGLTIAAVLHVALMASTGSEYQEALSRAEKAGKPLLVLVGTESCSDCREMKEDRIPELVRNGELKDLVFASVESTDKPGLTRQLLRGETLPQLVLYTPVGKLWRRTHIAGVHSPNEIQDYLKREIAKGLEVAEKAKPENNWYTPSTYSYSSGSS